ncbi:putative defense protein 3 [Liolophura sinensis]|uniref:putative defense protein 3 n=1 Tax=Liolophura sinensis TaxID=3198878 RepID=UPI003159733F
MAVNGIAVLLAIVGCLDLVGAYPRGPPPTVCASMAPATFPHGEAQNIASPYTVSTSQSTYMPGETITVTLSSPGNTAFRGVFVQARLKNGQSTDPQGTFMLSTEESQLKLMTCGNRAGSAVSHNSRDLKTSKTFSWKAPDTNVGDVRFMATFVQATQTYWTGVMSEDVIGSTVTTASTTEKPTTTTMKPTTTTMKPTMTTTTTKTIITTSTRKAIITTIRTKSTSTAEELMTTTETIRMIQSTASTTSAPGIFILALLLFTGLLHLIFY